MTPLVDAHLHLQFPELLGDVDIVVKRAKEAGVTAMVCNGTSPADWPVVADLARRHRCIIPCFGVHPWHVAQATAGWEDQLNRHLDAMPSAVGEIGIDRWIEPRDEMLQERVFRRQLAIARERRLPVMIHCLRAWDWLMQILASEPPLPAGMLIHAYGGSVEMIPRLSKRGALFSFTGATFEPRRQKLRDALRAVPRDRLLAETDAPSMLPPEGLRVEPPTCRGVPVPNEPGNLPLIVRAMAGERGEDETELRQAMGQNAARLLGALLHG
jgi:TatD DNase family protein